MEDGLTRAQRYRRKYPDRVRQTLAVNAAGRRERNSVLLAILKEAEPCADCGERYPARVMDYHHVRGTKLASVSRLSVAPASWARIEAEIDKCVLLCANCHRLRHCDD